MKIVLDLEQLTPVCALQGFPAVENRVEQLGGTWYARLRIPVADYARLAPARSAFLRIQEGSDSLVDRSTILKGVAGWIASHGYLLLPRADGGEAPLVAEFSSESVTDEPSPGGLWKGSVSAKVRLLKRSDMTVLQEWTIGPLKDAAFNKQKLREKLASQLRQATAQREP